MAAPLSFETAGLRNIGALRGGDRGVDLRYPKGAMALQGVSSNFPAVASDALTHEALTHEALAQQISELGEWFHNIDLHGIQTAPNHFLGDFPNVKWRHISPALPTDLTGATV